jgi:hypothetical protein
VRGGAPVDSPADRQAIQDSLEDKIVERFILPAIQALGADAEECLGPDTDWSRVAVDEFEVVDKGAGCESDESADKDAGCESDESG